MKPAFIYIIASSGAWPGIGRRTAPMQRLLQYPRKGSLLRWAV